MYVLPFFSYRPAGDGMVLTNHITGARCVAGWDAFAELEAAYEGSAAASPGAAVDELALLFEDRDAYDRWMDAAAGRAVGDLPQIEQIELTNRCPYTCVMCPRTSRLTRDLGDMSLGLFASLMREVEGSTRFCALHHFGESLLHRGVADAVRIALGRGIRTGLSCNPPSLLPDRARRILDAGIANLVLSLDSVDPDVYRSIRGRAARFDVADRNLREAVRLRDEGGHDAALTLQMISMHANQDEAERFLAYCADVGVDRGVVIRFERWDFEDDVVAELGHHDSPGYTAPCSRPWRSVAVMWDGRVVPCCHDYDGEMVLGDLNRQSLEEIWNGPVARRFRTENR